MNPEIELLEDTSRRIRFQVKGEEHTFCQMLCSELWNDDSVKLSAYSIAHPLVSLPEVIVETAGKEPREAIKSAATRVRRTAGNFITAFNKSLK